MSDGGRESGRHIDSEPRKRSSGDDFGRAIAKIAVAQICDSAGFQGFQQSALEALSDIAIRYVRDLGNRAHFYANLASRTDCNVLDIIQGLEDLIGSTQGFSGASDVNRCVLASGTVREIAQYVHSAEEIPFVRPITRFPVVRSRKPTPSFAQLGEEPPGKHIPDWLPAFPDRHTYVHSPGWNDRTTDAKTDKIEQAKQRRRADRSLVSLQQRLANGSAAHSAEDPIDSGRTKRVLEGNPFLAPPVQSWEKDVLPVTLPDKLVDAANVSENVSVLDAFTPAIEAVKRGDTSENDKKVLPHKRSTVHFSFGIHGKSIATTWASGPSSSTDKVTSWFGRDDEMDEKKRRAEQILKEAMENHRELPQL